MSKIRSISGFPEWLPQEKLVEDRLIALIRGIYESHGFVPVETPAVELLSTLSEKGIADKELFAVRRAKAEADEESELGLHFDLTVPFARYTAQHLNDLVFPFRRYQLQKVWRGERPQRGRSREFYQFDIDVIARDVLPLACDAEVVSVIDKVFRAIDLGSFTIRVNNRKVLCGFLADCGLAPAAITAAVVVIDKLLKVGPAEVGVQLKSEAGATDQQIRRILEFAELKLTASTALSALQSMGVSNPQFIEGLEELGTLVELLPDSARESVSIEPNLARGLDYYTGLIVEVILDGHPEYGSVCGGGRYADLASQFINKALPGVGVSIGLTRLMELMIANKLRPFDRRTNTKVVVAVNDEAQRRACNAVADQLRSAGVNTEVFISSPKIGKQIDYAAKLGVPYVAFVQADGGVEIKDIRSGEQQRVGDIVAWGSSIEN